MTFERIDSLLRELDPAEHPSLVHPFLLDALKEIVRLLKEQETRQLVHAVSKLSLKPGDALVAKLGNPINGWIPGPEHEERFVKLMTAVLGGMGFRGNDVTCLIWDHGLQLTKVEGGARKPLQSARSRRKKLRGRG